MTAKSADTVAPSAVRIEVVDVADEQQLRRWVELRNASDTFDSGTYDETLASQQAWDGDLVRVIGVDGAGSDIVAARAWKAASEPEAGALRIAGDPAAATFDDLHVVAAWLELWLVGLEATTIRTWAHDDQPRVLQLWTDRGWRDGGRKPAVELHVASVQPQQTPTIDGIEFALLASRPRLARAVYDCYVASWAHTEWARRIPPYVPWWESIERVYDDPGEHFLLALAGDEVAGFAELQFAGTSRSELWHAYTGVHPDHRRRGIATALKRWSIEWARERGVRRLLAANDETNAAMRAVNAKLGYEHAFSYVSFERQLASSGRIERSSSGCMHCSALRSTSDLET